MTSKEPSRKNSVDTDKSSLTLTISIGIAQTGHNITQPDSVQSLLLLANRALFTAKQTGATAQ
jgi:PleD family two-component response regulator